MASSSPPMDNLLLSIPGELRNKIYGYALEYPDLAKLQHDFDDETWAAIEAHAALLAPGEDDFDKIWDIVGEARYNVETPYPRIATATILLLNKQISKEALGLLRKKALIIDWPVHDNIFRNWRYLEFKHLMPDGTLRALRKVHLVFRWEDHDSWDLESPWQMYDWAKNVDMLVKVWEKGNKLEEIEFTVEEGGEEEITKEILDEILGWITQLRAIAPVIYQGPVLAPFEELGEGVEVLK